jgi:hypothetical protein
MVTTVIEEPTLNDKFSGYLGELAGFEGYKILNKLEKKESLNNILYTS